MIEIETASSTAESGGRLLRHDVRQSEKQETCGIRGISCPVIWTSVVRGATLGMVLLQQDLPIRILHRALVRRIVVVPLAVAFEAEVSLDGNVRFTMTTATDITTLVSVIERGDVAVHHPLCAETGT